MRVHRSISTLTCLVACGVLVLVGCDPKLTGTDGGGGGDDDDDEVAIVTPQARAVGAIVGLHMDLITEALQEAATFAESGPTPRSPTSRPQRGTPRRADRCPRGCRGSNIPGTWKCVW